MAAEALSVSSEFDIFAQKPVQTSVQETIETIYRPIASVDQSDLEFLIPAEHDTYIDLNIKLYVRGKLTAADGKDLDSTDFTATANNLLHSLFTQCSITLNGTTITPTSDLYQYRSYLETLLTYGRDASTSHLTNSFWYLDSGDLQACDPTESEPTNTGFVARWNRIKQSKEVQLIGRLHSDICNVVPYLLPGVKLQIKLTKGKRAFYLMSTKADSTTKFQFHEAYLIVNRIRPNPSYLIAHNTALAKGALARYNLTRVELKTFTFSPGPKSLSVDNAVLGQLPKRLLFTMIKNKDFTGSLDSNPFYFNHFNLNHFTLYYNGKPIPSEGLPLDMSHEKTSVLAYNTLFEGSGIRHSNAGLQVTHRMFIAGYFMLLFDLTPDRAASEGHISLPDQGNIRLELRFDKPLSEAITCLLYLEYDNCVRIDQLRTVSADF